MQKVLVSGGTGFVGKEIIKLLIQRGDEVYVLTRNVEKCNRTFDNKVQAILWESYNDTFDCSELTGLHSVINLVGESVSAKRWNDNQKKEIYNSRIVATDNIFKSLRKSNIIVDQFISTSAIGFYGTGFLKEVCDKWEEAARKGKDSYKRLAIIRVPVVLGASAGMIKELTPIYKLGLGGKLGSGKQMMSWIHVTDLARMYVCANDNSDMQGALDATSRFNVTNEYFSKSFAKLMGSKSRFNVPQFMLYLAKGEMSSAIMESHDITPEQFNEKMFEYQYATIELALKDIVSQL